MYFASGFVIFGAAHKKNKKQKNIKPRRRANGVKYDQKQKTWLCSIGRHEPHLLETQQE